MSLLSLLLIAPLVGQPAVRPPDSQALDTIAALEDLRAGTAQLEAFTAPPHSPSVRARAFLALGRGEMDGDRLGETFAAGLQDRDTDVRVMVAFAIFATLGASLVVLVLDDRNPFAMAAAAILVIATVHAGVATARRGKLGPLGWIALAWWLASLAGGWAALRWLPS